MQKLLTKEQVERICEKYHNHPLLIACKKAFLRYGETTESFLFSPEDVFCHAVYLLEDIRSQEYSQDEINILWTNLIIEIRQKYQNVSLDDRKVWASSVFYVVALSLSLHWSENYCEKARCMFLNTIKAKNATNDEEELHIVHDLVLNADKLSDWINEFMDGAFCLSEEIESVITKNVKVVMNPQITESPIFAYSEKKEIIKCRLNQLLKGKKKPKDVCQPVRAAIDAGVIRRPTWEEFKSEFGENLIKSKSSYSNYTNPGNKPYTGQDYSVMVQEFKQLIAK